MNLFTKSSSLFLASLIAFSIFMSVANIFAQVNGKVLSDGTVTLWGLIFILLSILWATNDAKERSYQRPFDFDFLVYIFWPVAFPWYLVMTRGLKGVLMFFGFLLIFVAPTFVGLLPYFYYE